MLYLCFVALILVSMLDFLNAVSIYQIEAQQGPPKPCDPQTADQLVQRGGRMIPTSPLPDKIIGSDESDTIIGEDGDDCLMGKLGDDEIEGGMGSDILIGGQGDDTLDGGESDDRGKDIFFCDGTGGDIVKNWIYGVDTDLGKCQIER